jgi:DNA adenine methylase
MYGGYMHSHYRELLETISTIQGKFLLSSYPSDLLEEYTKKNGWFTKTFEKPLSAAKANNKPRRRKIEVLTANYPI